MNREKKLLKNTAILTVGNICTKLVTFFLLPLYTAVLTTEEYGTVDLLNTLVSLFLPIVTFQIEQAAFRFLIDVREQNEKQKDIISTSFFTVLLQCFVYVLLFLIISYFIHNNYKWFLLMNLLLYIFSSLFQQIARGFGDNKTYAISSFVSAGITILFNLLFILKLGLGAYGMLIGTAIGQLVCSLYVIFKLRLVKYIKLANFSRETLKKLWNYSIPLIPNSISWWIFNASDRIIVSLFLGLSANGILAASHKFSAVYITFYNVFHLSWLESISLHVNDEDIQEFYNKMMNTVMNFFLSIGVGIVACMPFVYSIMIDSNYFEGYYQVPIIMIGSVFNVLVALETAIYVAKKNTKAIANTSIVSAIINIIIHLCFIKFIGLYAAAFSTLIAYLVMFIYRYIDIRKKYFKLQFDKKNLRCTIIALLLILPIYYMENTYLYICGLIVAIVYAYIINKKTIQQIKDILNHRFMKKGV